MTLQSFQVAVPVSSLFRVRHYTGKWTERSRLPTTSHLIRNNFLFARHPTRIGANWHSLSRNMHNCRSHAPLFPLCHDDDLGLVSLLFTEQTKLSTPIAWAVRVGFVAAPVLVSAGFFGAALGDGRTRPSGLIALLWIGVFVLGGSLVTLGIALIQARG